MSRESRMIKTTIIYFVGNFASKLLAFFLLPLYTAYLTPEDFGAVDMVTSTLPLIAPIFTMQVTESVFRFLCSYNDNWKRKKIITNSTIIFIIGLFIFIISFIPFSMIYKFNFSNLFIVYFISVYLGIFFQQILRGFHMNLDYAIIGVVSTLVQASLNILFITKVNMGGEALLIAAIGSSIVISIVSALRIKIWKFIDFKLIEKDIIIKQLKYGIPLIPNQICWWIIGLLGKYILVYFQGSADNGILAVASKFPGLLTTISSIFFLAWTENIIQEYNSKDRDEYFSKAFTLFFIFSLCAAACLLPVIKIYNILTIGSEYRDAWVYIPILFIGALFNGFASFLGTIYTASMQTKDAFITTVIGAVSNLIFSIILTPILGILGVVIANMISFIILFYARIKSVNKIVNISINWKESTIPIVLLSLSLIVYYKFGLGFQIAFLVMFILGSIYINKEIILDFLNRIKREKS
ncbi:oligosaccharide flippase family protein [Clostridium perfringens]|nr:oligosaccharide flippase family protein [Clostridium perfringens]